MKPARYPVLVEFGVGQWVGKLQQAAVAVLWPEANNSEPESPGELAVRINRWSGKVDIKMPPRFSEETGDGLRGHMAARLSMLPKTLIRAAGRARITE